MSSPPSFSHSLLVRCASVAAGAVLLAGLLSCAVSVNAQLAPVLPSASVLKRMTVEELMDIEVTSVSKRPEKLSETASGIQVITAEDIRRSGATNLPETLRLASNLEVAQIDSRQWAISARGFNNVFADKMLVLIDGRSVYTPLYAGVYWDVQDTLMEDIDRVEVISGPGTTQWGANAVNGVINISTKSAKDTQGGLIVGEVGAELRDGASVRYGGQLAPRVYYRVYAKYFERDDTVRPNGRDARDSWRIGQAGFRVDWDRRSGDVLTLQGDIYSGSLGSTRPGGVAVNGGNTLARWTRAFSDTSELKVQVYYDHTHRNIPASFIQTLDTFDLDIQHRLVLADIHAIVWGVGYRVVEDNIQNTPANAFLPPRVSRAWSNVFAQDEIAIRANLHLTLGSKVEHNDYTGVEVEPSIRLAWLPTKDQTLWGAVSRAVRTPSRIDRDLYSPANPPYRIAGGPNVLSEKLQAYELGYRLQVQPQLAVSLATFYNDYDDLRGLEPLNPPAPFPVESSSGFRGRSWGAELSGDWRVSNTWRLHAGYTELRADSELQPGSIDRSIDRSSAHDPKHQFLIRSFWDISSNWEFDSDLRYVGPIENQRVPGYTELRLHVGWHPSARWELSLVGENLLHKLHAEFNTPGSRREIQRGGYLKASWRF